MGYYDPPEDNEFLGCYCCGADEDKIIENDDGELICTDCHTEQHWAFNHQDLRCWLPETYFHRTCTTCDKEFSYSLITIVWGMYGDFYPTCQEHVEYREGQIKLEKQREAEALKELVVLILRAV